MSTDLVPAQVAVTENRARARCGLRAEHRHDSGTAGISTGWRGIHGNCGGLEECGNETCGGAETRGELRKWPAAWQIGREREDAGSITEDAGWNRAFKPAKRKEIGKMVID